MLDPLEVPELLTPSQMGEADRAAIVGGTPGIALMERAGLCVQRRQPVNQRASAMPGRGRPFQKGQSGNPGGRPSNPEKKLVADVKAAAKEHTGDAVKTLAEVMINERSPPAARVAAATALLDRGWGRPTRPVEANVSIFDTMSLAEKEAMLAMVEAAKAAAFEEDAGKTLQ